MTEVTKAEVTGYWVDELGPAGWYKSDPEVDQTIRDRFGAAWEDVRRGGYGWWRCSPQGSLAYLILTDQFPRNMFRDDPRAFLTDRLARAAAIRAITQGWDMRVGEPERQFFYLPLVHSEVLEDQERGVRLILTRLSQRPDGMGAENLLHARAHREVIRRFGRFPFRNAALGRPTTAGEQGFLDKGGYGAVVRELKDAA